MFIIKNKYFLLIESIKEIDLKNIKVRDKYSIIYRDNKKIDEINDLLNVRQKGKKKAINLFVANNIKLALSLNSNGIYISSHNKDLKYLNFKRKNFKIIGSAHNFKEVSLKIRQGCSTILLSKLFMVNYDNKAPYLGVVKFNSFSKISNKILPLGGISDHNLNKMKNVFGDGFALLSEVKKKPAKIFSLLL